ncbi:MAG TPA: SDR family NAD(P)-dependent oxidoreductase [Stellaceae bacterium]
MLRTMDRIEQPGTEQPGTRLLISDRPLPRPPLRLSSFDSVLGRNIIELNVWIIELNLWAVRQGLHGTPADPLLDGFCRRLIEAGEMLLDFPALHDLAAAKPFRNAAHSQSGRCLIPAVCQYSIRSSEEDFMYALNGRVGLVTGAGGGIGREIARRFARDGMAVAVLDRDGEAAQKVSAEIGGLALAADVTSPEDMARAVAETLARFGRIDLLVNNAGIAWTGPTLEMPLDTLQAMLRVNVEGVFIASQAVLPHMIARRSGAIVNLASWAGKTGAIFYAGYSASKFAVIGLTQSLAREMATHGIRVNAICPGIVVDTAMRSALEAQQRQWGLPQTAERQKLIPIGRVSVPEDVARVAAFLASDEAAYITGESINLSGGLLMD